MATQELSAYEKFIIAITPESQAEKEANELIRRPVIIGEPNPWKPLDPDTATTPAVLITAKRAVNNLGDSISTGIKDMTIQMKNAAIFGVIIVVVVGVLWTFSILRR